MILSFPRHYKGHCLNLDTSSEKALAKANKLAASLK